MLTEITCIFKKFEGYILSGIGSRSVPVDRLAGRQKCDLVQVFLKSSSGQMLQYLACLNYYSFVRAVVIVLR